MAPSKNDVHLTEGEVNDEACLEEAIPQGIHIWNWLTDNSRFLDLFETEQIHNLPTEGDCRRETASTNMYIDSGSPITYLTRIP
jgi:hypothetical protein